MWRGKLVKAKHETVGTLRQNDVLHLGQAGTDNGDKAGGARGREKVDQPSGERRVSIAISG